MNLLLIDPSESVSNLVIAHSECAEVLRRHRIDYCFGGGRSLQEAAKERDVDFETLTQELLAAICDRGAQNLQDPRELSTSELVAHIIEKHHTYLRKTLPLVSSLAAKVAGVHGTFDPALSRLADAVDDLAEGLNAHIDQEEESLFPVLLSSSSDALLVAERLHVTTTQHAKIASQLSRVRESSGNFVLPEWACASYKTLISELEHLESDVFALAHLESHVLLPRFQRDGAGDQCTKLFKKEHARFGALLELLEEQLGVLTEGGDPEYELVLDIFEYLSEFADRFHHPLEGRVFALVSEREPKLHAFVRDLEKRHRVISQLGETLVSSLRAAQNDTVVSRESVVIAARAYVFIFREHMALEEEHLFDLVAAEIGEPSWLAEELSARKNPLFGHEVTGRFRSLRRRLANSSYSEEGT